MKKAAFVVRRNIYYKFFGLIIDHFIREGVEVHLLHLAPEMLQGKHNPKDSYHPFLNQIPHFSGPAHSVICRDDTQLSQYLARHGILNVYSLESRAHYPELPPGIVFHALQHGIDSVKETAFDADYFYMHGPGWLGAAGFKPKHIGEIVPVGIYYVNDRDAYDREKILEKYALPRDRRFVVYMPLPFMKAAQYPFLGGRIRGYLPLQRLIREEWRILADLKALFDPLGITLLIKSQVKRILDPRYAQFGKILYDETFFPSTVPELISISDMVLCNMFPSAMCTEAATLRTRFVILETERYRADFVEYFERYSIDAFFPNGMEDFVANDRLERLLPLLEMGRTKSDPQAAPPNYLGQYILDVSHAEKMNAFMKRLA